MATQRYFRPWYFIFPGAALGLITLGYPIFQAIYHSFHAVTMRRLGDGVFVGLDNFAQLFGDHLFMRSIVATVHFTLGSTLLAVGFGLFIASVMSSRGIRGTALARFFMAFFLIPFVTTQVVTGILGRLYVWQTSYGLVNFLLETVGLERVRWLTSMDHAMTATVITNGWRMAPLALLIFYAALATIPDEIVESAEVDGASFLTLWFRIKYPMIRFHLGFVSLIILTSAFREFDVIYGLTGGGPGRSTEVLSILVYRLGVTQGNMGMANAVSVTMLVIVSVITIAAVKIGKLGAMSE
ncbi:carbohydrate ABC transporter membrane protein 1, CUT1 family [Alkalispirochaeta americana]|uniref:Carbohydrate ABC transporter membrane protein 1, CUT1 family n=1 Tax=Alkalispirochaeta americana TaxID=159291 RepID=A0A1N6U372_9SPIO|nr:sugar ABC transporter permease [Alkalispirochaeta americana]SIQ60108.1 carbohydrate ABC transporter membrane protein 1, CUT1 family [Alkalispirochaeta americana]